MKKYLAIFLSFIIIFSAALVAVQVYAAQDSDTVRYTETTLSGDKSEIEGIHVDLRLHCDEHLFWNIGYTMGENEEYDVDFEHLYSEPEYRGNSKPSFDIIFRFTSWGGSSSGDMLEDNSLFGQYDMIADVASRAPAGETYREIVYLSDYYEYYPITYSMHLNDAWCNENYVYDNHPDRKYGEMFTAIQNRFEEYFKVPILPTEQREITVEKRADGTVASIHSSYPDGKNGVYAYSPSIISDSAIYFLLDPRVEGMDSIQLDMSEMGDGYGIYRIPYEVTDYDDPYYSTYTNVKIDELALVYPLEVGVTVEDMVFSDDESEIFLTTRHMGEEEDEIRLTVIDVPTMTDQQSTEIFTCAADEYFTVHSYHDDFILYEIGYEKYAVVEKVGGIWRTAFVVEDESVNAAEYTISYYNDTTAAYDGERLVIAGYSYEVGGNGMESAESHLASFYLSVYSAEGNLYTGKFTSTLDTGTFLAYNETCRPTDDSVIGITLP